MSGEDKSTSSTGHFRTSPSSPPGSSSDLSSLNTLRLALLSMKERCQRHERRAQELERQAAASAEDVRRLRDANTALREKNVELKQQLCYQRRENDELCMRFDCLRTEHGHSLMRLEKLQLEIADLTASASLDQGMDDGDSMCEGEAQLHSFKEKLLDQQTQLREALRKVAQGMKDRMRSNTEEVMETAPVSDTPVPADDKTAPVPLSTSESTSEKDRITRVCPMCEVAFASDFTQEEFEAHVEFHFTYEESETLQNYDLVHDAPPF